MEKFKTKNLFLAGIMTVAMAVLMLFGFTACGGNPNSLESYGFNANGEYVGETLDMDEGTVTKSAFDMNEGDYVFFRFAGTNGHGYHIEDWDAWSWDDNDDILGDVSAFTLVNGTPTAYALTASEPNTTPITLGEDGYVYIVVHASADKDDAMLYFVEDHIYNAAGICEADGSFITNVGGYRGTDLPVGSVSKTTGITYTNDGKADYFLIHEDTNELAPYTFGNEKFHITTTLVPIADVELYYIDANNGAHQISFADGNEGIVPEGVTKLVVVINHNSDVTNGGYTLSKVVA